MANDITPIDPKRFGLASFADILPRRQPIPGEDPATFEAVREGMFVTLAPMTPHECLLAENLVQIEWDRVQHSRMR